MTTTPFTILVFDDQPENYTWLEDVFGVENVIITSRQHHAIKAYHDRNPTVIVSDICAGGPPAVIRYKGTHPTWTGLNFIHIIREENPSIPIIAFTSCWEQSLQDILKIYKAEWIPKDTRQLKDTLKYLRDGKNE